MRIFLDTIGCRLNQAEIERLAGQFRAAGHAVVATAAEADLAIVNTCTVTGAAASDSRAAVRRANRLGAGQVVVTGCWATLEPGVAASLPGVRRIVPNLSKDSLAADLLDLPQEFFDLEPLARVPLPGSHARTRAFIKVQDGCDNACTYCITTLARGASRSRPVDQVVVDVISALEGGAKEIVLTGVHLGAWGSDFSPPQHLSDLISALLARTSIPRLRLSSLEPWDLDAGFFLLWHDPRVCRHLHLPLQSGSASVLKRMARKTTPEKFAALMESARSAIPEVAITTDIIIGFPGETQAEFTETVDFIRAMNFAGGHVFTYSARPGTPASRMQGRVRLEVQKQRGALLRKLFAEAAQVYATRFTGQTLSVLWESRKQFSDRGWRLEGHTDNHLRVAAVSPEPRWNHLDRVRLTAVQPGYLEGEIVEKNISVEKII